MSFENNFLTYVTRHVQSSQKLKNVPRAAFVIFHYYLGLPPTSETIWRIIRNGLILRINSHLLSNLLNEWLNTLKNPSEIFSPFEDRTSHTLLDKLTQKSSWYTLINLPKNFKRALTKLQLLTCYSFLQ